MSLIKLKISNKNANYPIFIGNNIIKLLPRKLRTFCPNVEKVGIVIDKKVLKKNKSKIKSALKKYKTVFFQYSSEEKLKSFNNANNLIEKCISENFKRSDVIITFGGGVLGDFSAFAASLIKRGINFVNVPTTLLAQVDSSVGGKTGVNSKKGKNLIGTFFQPKFVLIDVAFLKTLPKRELICGYAEILKHAIIKDSSFFKWLEKNSYEMINNRNLKLLKIAIKKSCQIKIFFVNRDVHESNLRMTLNFGHTFAHAIEAKNKYAKNINHGEAVLIGMMLATKLSHLKKICNFSTLSKIKNIYEVNNLNYNLKSFFNKKSNKDLVGYMSKDKKNDDKKINLILLKKIGKTTTPGKYKISSKNLLKNFNSII